MGAGGRRILFQDLMTLLVCVRACIICRGRALERQMKEESKNCIALSSM